jgi:hypothetical protein
MTSLPHLRLGTGNWAKTTTAGVIIKRKTSDPTTKKGEAAAQGIGQ